MVVVPFTGLREAARKGSLRDGNSRRCLLSEVGRHLDCRRNRWVELFLCRPIGLLLSFLRTEAEDFAHSSYVSGADSADAWSHRGSYRFAAIGIVGSGQEGPLYGSWSKKHVWGEMLERSLDVDWSSQGKDSILTGIREGHRIAATHLGHHCTANRMPSSKKRCLAIDSFFTANRLQELADHHQGLILVSPWRSSRDVGVLCLLSRRAGRLDFGLQEAGACLIFTPQAVFFWLMPCSLSCWTSTEKALRHGPTRWVRCLVQGCHSRSVGLIRDAAERSSVLKTEGRRLSFLMVALLGLALAGPAG